MGAATDFTRSSMPHRDSRVGVLQPQGSSRMGGSCIVEWYLEWCWAEAGAGKRERKEAREPRDIKSFEWQLNYGVCFIVAGSLACAHCSGLNLL